MDIPTVIRKRLKELGLDQRDLASAAQVTESYISQLLTRKRAAPAPARTDIYDKIGEFLKFPPGELSRLAELQRLEDLKRRVVELPPALFRDWRELLLRKCEGPRRRELRRVFEREPFSPLERLITRKLLGVAQGILSGALGSEDRLRQVCHVIGRSDEEMRIEIMDLLDVDVFNINLERWVSLFDPLIEKWDIDLETFDIEIVVNRSLKVDNVRRFEFVERERPAPIEPGLEEFLRNPAFRSDATEDEVVFLKAQRFTSRRPTAMYYYRQLQCLRDPLNFRARRPSE
jgi:transcriptional regulator with XRE-family HTH domain